MWKLIFFSGLFFLILLNNHRIYCQWENIETPRASYVTSFGYYNNLVLAGTFFNGLFLSNDFGKTWILSNQGLSSNIIIHSILAYDNFVLLGTSLGIYRSADTCKSWQKLNLPGIPVYSLCSHKTYIFAGCSTYGLLRSSDNGENWESIPLVHDYFSVFSIVTKDNLILVATNKGIFASSDNGNNWNNITDDSFKNSSTVFSTIVVYENSIFTTTAPVWWSPLRHYSTKLFKTDDLGKNWEQIATFPNETEITSLAVHSDRIYAAT